MFKDTRTAEHHGSGLTAQITFASRLRTLASRLKKKETFIKEAQHRVLLSCNMGKRQAQLSGEVPMPAKKKKERTLKKLECYTRSVP